MIPWKVFWSVTTSLVTGTFGVLEHLHIITPWITIALVAAISTVFTVVTSWVVAEAPVFALVPEHGRKQIVRLVAAAAVAHTLWAVANAMRPDLLIGWLLALTALGCITYMVAAGHQYMLEQMAPVSSGLAKAQQETAQLDRDTNLLVDVFEKAGYHWLNLRRWETVGDPQFGIRVWVRVPAVSTINKKTRTHALTQADAEPIAIELANTLGQEIMTSWVRIKKEEAAGTYTILIVTEDVMGRIYEYQDDQQWSTITTPKLIGYGMDGQPYRTRLDTHGQISGMSRWGKTSLVHVEWAEITKCANTLLWVAGVEKLYDAVGGWIEPYSGCDEQLPIDWIASGQKDLLDMLVSAMQIARWRQRQPMHAREGFSTILIYLDEASFALRNTKAKAEYNGVPYTASQLVAMIRQGAGSASIYCTPVSQRSVNSHFGDQGGDVTANAGRVAAFKTRDAADIGRLTGDYHLMPSHKGEYIFEDGDGPVPLKAPYLQEVDPSKQKLHEGLTISDVAWSRRNFRRDMDPGSAQAGGDTYLGRHTRMTPEFLAYLTSAITLPGESADHTEGYEIATAELDALGIGTPKTVTPTPPPPAGQVTTLMGRRPRAARIADIVASAEGPISRTAIMAALADDGDNASEQTVTNALKKLLDDQQLRRVDRGMYEARSNAQ